MKLRHDTAKAPYVYFSIVADS